MRENGSGFTPGTPGYGDVLFPQTPKKSKPASEPKPKLGIFDPGKSGDDPEGETGVAANPETGPKTPGTHAKFDLAA